MITRRSLLLGASALAFPQVGVVCHPSAAGQYKQLALLYYAERGRLAAERTSAQMAQLLNHTLGSIERAGP